jgi:anthranilate synthase/aminodeoxychorismate synthase-like glutamine amidotransferase
VVVDNYDSFTENLAHLLAQLGARVVVVRNDAATVAEVLASKPAGVVISPGPKAPKEAGISVPLIRACAHAAEPIPVLGVCLGHQAIGEAFGGRTVRARRPAHGRALPVFHEGRGALAGLPCPFLAARYHSLVIDPDALPADLEPTAWSREGDLMAVLHRRLPIEGVQFHPESYLTGPGPRILAAFLRRAGLSPRPVREVVR